MGDAVIVLAGALAVDVAFGEPPAAVHPVVWMGRLQAGLRRLAPARPAAALLWGAAMAVGGPALFGLGAWWALSRTDGWLRLGLGIYLLKSALAGRALAAAARTVERALGRGDLAGARAGLRSLVSRDTARLDAPRLAAAAVESVAENASDSLVAPLLYYAIGGVPAAIAYRAINTLDAMIGYRGETEWLGKAAARLDDLANLIPARLTALLLALSSPAGHGSPARALAIWRRDARLTESPNAGHPMAAMAGALGVELEKVGAYRLGAGFRAARAEDVGRAVRVFVAAAAWAALLVLGALVISTLGGARRAA